MFISHIFFTNYWNVHFHLFEINTTFLTKNFFKGRVFSQFSVSFSIFIKYLRETHQFSIMFSYLHFETEIHNHNIFFLTITFAIWCIKFTFAQSSFSRFDFSSFYVKIIFVKYRSSAHVESNIEPGTTRLNSDRFRLVPKST